MQLIAFTSAAAADKNDDDDDYENVAASKNRRRRNRFWCRRDGCDRDTRQRLHAVRRFALRARAQRSGWRFFAFADAAATAAVASSS